MKSILIIKHGALGDVIRTSYFVKPLYEQYGNPDIYWFTSKNSVPLLRFNPYIHFLTYEPSDLCDKKFDWVISLDDETEILESLRNIKYKKLTGAYLLKNKKKYSENSALWFDMGLISKYGKKKADELKKINKRGHADIFSKILQINGISPVFYNSEIIEKRFLKIKQSEYFHIGINSGSGGRWESKKLRISEAIKLVDLLTAKTIYNKPVFIHLLGGKDEVERNNKIHSKIDRNERVDITDSEGSLLRFAAIVKSCDYIISSDSLALHMAISQSVPNLSFFAPTSAVEIDTFGTGVKVISTAPDYCNYKSDCDNSTITAERIITAFMDFIER